MVLFLVPMSFAGQPQTADDKAQRVQEERIQILRTERDETAKRLREAQASVSSAEKRDEAEKIVVRLQGDLKAIDSELQRVEGRKPIATVNPPSVAASAAPAEDKKAVAFKSWDVFQNFGK